MGFKLLLASVFVAVSVVSSTFLIAQDNNQEIINSEEFKNYWYAGKAEITSYKLEQARYGELHSGYAVLVYVTEDFSVSKHVKLDNPGQNVED